MYRSAIPSITSGSRKRTGGNHTYRQMYLRSDVIHHMRACVRASLCAHGCALRACAHLRSYAIDCVRICVRDVLHCHNVLMCGATATSSCECRSCGPVSRRP